MNPENCSGCREAVPADDVVWVSDDGEATTGPNGRPWCSTCAPEEPYLSVRDSWTDHRRAEFVRWLTRQKGVEVQVPLPGELVRFRIRGRLGTLRLEGEPPAHARRKSFVAYGIGALLVASYELNVVHVPVDAGVDPREREAVMSRLVKRDGHACFYCGDSEAELTLEHVLGVTHGGPSCDENLVPACRDCNDDAADKSVSEKIKFRDQRLKNGRRKATAGSLPSVPAPVDITVHDPER